MIKLLDNAEQPENFVTFTARGEDQNDVALPNRPQVAVHCIGGRHRTGALTAVYRMTQDGWTADRAFSEMKRYHFGADFLHPALKTFVYSYFSQLNNAPKMLVALGTPSTK